MNTPLVSILVPVYRVEKYINRCARSVFEQTYSNIEYIFVDDCSPDNSIAILQQIIDEYPNRKDQLKILHHDHNRGLAVARNSAVDAAHGEFIIHVDSDDWIEPNAIELLVNKQIETGADIVSGNALAHYIDKEKELIEPEYSSVDEMVHQTIQMTLDHVIWRRLIRRSLYVENHICAMEGVNVGEDHYTLPRLVYYAKTIAKVDKIIYHYNLQNDTSYTQTKDYGFAVKKYEANVKALDILIDFFSNKEANLVAHIEQIKFEYLYKNLWYTAKFGERKYFDQIKASIIPLSQYTNTINIGIRHLHFVLNHYAIDRLIVLLRILQYKLTKKKNYKL